MLNQVMIIGNLGAKPELRYTESGNAVCNFRVASTERYKNREGEQQEETEWFKIVVWGKQAENVEKYLDTGSRVYVEGKLKTREWEDKDGNRRWTTEVVARRVQFLDYKSDNKPSAPEESSNEPLEDDDIPF